MRTLLLFTRHKIGIRSAPRSAHRAPSLDRRRSPALKEALLGALEAAAEGRYMRFRQFRV